MADNVISVELTVRAPFLFSGLNAPSFGINNGMLRNAKGQMIVPQSLLRGNMRHVIGEMLQQGAQFADGCHPDVLFGRATTSTTDETETETDGEDDNADGGRPNWAPARGILEFSDLVLVANDDAAKPDSTRALTRIAINEETGSVRTGALQVIESPFAVGECAIFKGDIRVGAGADVTDVVKIFKVAGGLIPALGANKSSGFGRVVGIRFARVTVDNDVAEKTPVPGFDFAASSASDYSVALTFDQPFLVNSTKLGTNVLKSDVNPSGAVIKGAMAAKLQSHGAQTYSDYSDILDAIIVRNAVLLPNGKDGSSIAHRPRTIPRSLALYADAAASDAGKATERFLDGFCDADDFKFYSALGGCRFSLDWKDPEWGKIAPRFGAPEPVGREVRTRTAIDAQQGIAATSQLFSEICIVPENRVWQTIISHDLTGDDRAKFARMMAIITDGGLPGIGSTRASANMVVYPLDNVIRPVKPDDKGLWRVTLQSDAILHSMSMLERQGAGTARWLRQSYIDYWSGLVDDWNSRNPESQVRFNDGSFDFYASQRYAGGYLAARYPLRDDKYYPYFVTEVGSVFRLDLEGAANAFIAVLCRSGLPAAHDNPAVAHNWQRFPFSPRLGFGEVSADAVDPDLQHEEIG
jgi:hypothetical protein